MNTKTIIILLLLSLGLVTSAVWAWPDIITSKNMSVPNNTGSTIQQENNVPLDTSTQAQNTPPTPTIADWQTYRNDVANFTISFPSNEKIQINEFPTYIRIQNYEAVDQQRLKTFEYFLEIKTNYSDCGEGIENPRRINFGNYSGIVGSRVPSGDQEGYSLVACAYGPTTPLFILITSGDESLTLQNKILTSLRFDR